GVSIATLLFIEQSQPYHRRRNIGVLRSQRFLANRQQALRYRSGLGIFSGLIKCAQRPIESSCIILLRDRLRGNAYVQHECQREDEADRSRSFHFSASRRLAIPSPLPPAMPSRRMRVCLVQDAPARAKIVASASLWVACRRAETVSRAARPA